MMNLIVLLAVITLLAMILLSKNKIMFLISGLFPSLLQNRLWQRDHRDFRAIQPDAGCYNDVSTHAMSDFFLILKWVANIVIISWTHPYPEHLKKEYIPSSKQVTSIKYIFF